MHQRTQRCSGPDAQDMTTNERSRVLSFCSGATRTSNEARSQTSRQYHSMSRLPKCKGKLVNLVAEKEDRAKCCVYDKNICEHQEGETNKLKRTQKPLTNGRSGGSVEEWSSEPQIRLTGPVRSDTCSVFDDGVPSWIPIEERCYWTNSNSFPGGICGQAAETAAKVCTRDRKERNFNNIVDGGQRALKTLFHARSFEMRSTTSSGSAKNSARLSQRCLPTWRNRWGYRRQSCPHQNAVSDRTPVQCSAQVVTKCKRQISDTSEDKSDENFDFNKSENANQSTNECYRKSHGNIQYDDQQGKSPYSPRKAIDIDREQGYCLNNRVNSSMSFVTLPKKLARNFTSIR